jgi:hypothetical protein
METGFDMGGSSSLSHDAKGGVTLDFQIVKPFRY